MPKCFGTHRNQVWHVRTRNAT